MRHIARSPSQIGATIRRIRNDKGLTQTQLAERIATAQKQISTFENGHKGTRIDTLFKILAALDLDIIITDRAKASARSIEDLL